MPPKPIRLPAVPRLLVKDPNPKAKNPCVDIMSGLLACWASSGPNTTGCGIIEQQLRACMDQPNAPPPPRNNINIHLARFKQRVTGKAKTH